MNIGFNPLPESAYENFCGKVLFVCLDMNNKLGNRINNSLVAGVFKEPCMILYNAGQLSIRGGSYEYDIYDDDEASV